MTPIRRALSALLLCATFTAAHAQYTGPSSIQLRTVKAMLDDGRDDDKARLQGRIVSHDGGDRYTFADDTGRMAVEIDKPVFPAGVPISDREVVELTGELERGFRKVKFEVKTLELLRPAQAASR